MRMKLLRRSLAISSLLLLTAAVQTQNVYICNSDGATRWHRDRACRGLKQCEKNVKQVSMADARKRKLTKCGFEK